MSDDLKNNNLKTSDLKTNGLKTKTSTAPKKSPAKTTAVKSVSIKPAVAKATVSKTSAAKVTVAKTPPVKSAQVSAAKTKAKPTKSVTVETIQAIKPKKSKLIRDSFTIPDHEYKLIQALKVRSSQFGVSLKKSELIRAGILKLVALSDTEFKKAIAAVDIIKTGRPIKAK